MILESLKYPRAKHLLPVQSIDDDDDDDDAQIIIFIIIHTSYTKIVL